MSEADNLFAVLRQSADPAAMAAIERLVAEGVDHELCRLNALAFAARAGLDAEAVIGALPHAARQDSFGQTVNITSRVQGLADSPTILATGPVVEHERAASLLASRGLAPSSRSHALRGIAEQPTLYAIS